MGNWLLKLKVNEILLYYSGRFFLVRFDSGNAYWFFAHQMLNEIIQRFFFLVEIITHLFFQRL